jgi:TrmH family RNA methyltransferase
MPDYVVILAEPLIAGNIGSVARSMSNFGVDELILFNPCELGDDAYRFSKHGRHIVENAKITESFDEALDGLDLIIGTSGIPTDNERKFLRHPMTPKDFAELVGEKQGRVGLVFGREDQGLSNEELAKCDILVTIPTAEANPIMNIAHAATVILYELYTLDKGPMEKTLAGSTEKETLNKLWAELLEEINYPEHKKAKTKVMFRKIVGRADLSEWEFHTLAGVVSRASKSINRKKRKNEG